MSIHLYLAPAGAGKTEYLLRRAQQATRQWAAPRVVVASALQARSWRRRLAEAGGALGVAVLTFDGLVNDCLQAAGAPFTELPDPVLFRLVRAVVDEVPLSHYAALRDRPGFIQILRRLFDEFKVARLDPAALAAAVSEPRLAELAQLYQRYQYRLHQQQWADRPGLGWLAVETLAAAPHVAADWPLLIFDGFDDFTTVQLALLGLLAQRAGETLIALTGDSRRPDRPAHRRFAATRARLEQTLAVTAQPLPHPGPPPEPLLAHLESTLFQPERPAFAGPIADPPLVLVAASDRAAEVRTALRWLKQRVMLDGLPLRRVALLARDIGPYRPFILQTASEFQLPILLLDGLPLAGNPAIAALLNLLRLARPTGPGGEPALPRRPVIDAWRSPYFDWTAVGLQPGDAERLDAAARYGRVMGGHEQWLEALEALAHRPEPAAESDEEALPPSVPAGDEARRLLVKFIRFATRLTPPAGSQPTRDWVRWLEQLIGQPDEAATNASLQLAARAAGPEDRAALRTLKDVLRGLVWAEEMVGQPPIDFDRFLAELEGAIAAASTPLPAADPAADRLLVADVVQARGVPFEAVAVLGLAEGEFPARVSEDPFLREEDRAELRDRHGLALESSLRSAEAEFFYDTISRARRRLLLTRPRLTDTGAEWQPSPYWEEVAALSGVTATGQTDAAPLKADEAASPVELAEIAAGGNPAAQRWLAAHRPTEWAAIDTAARLIALRQQPGNASPFDGDLSAWPAEFARRFAPARPWSASRLEMYRTCPYYFFAGRVLKLEPRLEPAAGLEAWQLGNIYHAIFEALYRHAADRTDVAQLLAQLDDVAGPILDAAPAKEGFRETAWWAQTRQEIIANVRLSVQKLAELGPEFTPAYFEQGFFGERSLRVTGPDGDFFRLHGVIDRIDIDAAGNLRLIDYKTSHAAGFRKAVVRSGKKLQLPLYALAARDALGLGQPADGFYWHIHQAEASDFTLAGFEDGPAAAIDTTVAFAWEAVRGARAGHFSPQPPAEGCPAYCPAAAFCWHYRPGYR